MSDLIDKHGDYFVNNTPIGGTAVIEYINDCHAFGYYQGLCHIWTVKTGSCIHGSIKDSHITGKWVEPEKDIESFDRKLDETQSQHISRLLIGIQKMIDSRV